MRGKTFTLALALAFAVTAPLVGCGSNSGQDASADNADKPAATEEQKTEETEAETDKKEDAKADEQAAEAEEAAKADEATAKEDEKAESEAAPAAKEEAPKGDYIDFDEMRFYVNGKKYVLGVNTLQDMIDDGVPFNESDLANAGNNLNPNYQSQGFVIELAEYYNAQVYAMNDSDENKPINECKLNEIYLPINHDIEQDILSFDFPLDITMDELIAACGEPDENRHWVSDDDETYYTDTLEYQRDSEKYLGHSDYRFEFTKGELKYVYINYMP